MFVFLNRTVQRMLLGIFCLFGGGGGGGGRILILFFFFLKHFFLVCFSHFKSFSCLRDY